MSSFMARALELAGKAAGKVSPNPAVGAVIVKDGRIAGEGYTSPPGGPHAEVIALHQAGEAARGSTLYVTLEPCSTYGKTPPCTRAIIEAGISEVLIAVNDPNPLHSGLAHEIFREAGIKVSAGDMAAEAAEVNESFFKWVRSGLPFVTAKYAMTLDGKIATSSGDSKWISSSESRAEVHRLRSVVDAVMVGVGTVIADNPELTARPPFVEEYRAPYRIIIDSSGRTPLQSRLLQDKEAAKTIIMTTSAAPADFAGAAASFGAKVIVTGRSAVGVDMRAALIELGKRQITSVLVEGGSSLLGSLFDGRLIDKLMVFIAPRLAGGRNALTPVGGEGIRLMSDAVMLDPVEARTIGPDVLVSGYPRWS
jgi:diaminohydroxyphosphoribosylaminopyrimidine deaminase / 5-amino-6-(5-phosphoribosylamino)uracil reductase